MKREQIIAMARESGMSFHLGMPHEAVVTQLSRFAQLVAAQALEQAQAEIEAVNAEELRQAKIIIELTEQLKYVAGIVLRGTGTPIPDDVPVHHGIAQYVHKLEGEIAHLKLKEPNIGLKSGKPLDQLIMEENARWLKDQEW